MSTNWLDTPFTRQVTLSPRFSRMRRHRNVSSYLMDTTLAGRIMVTGKSVEQKREAAGLSGHAHSIADADKVPVEFILAKQRDGRRGLVEPAPHARERCVLHRDAGLVGLRYPAPCTGRPASGSPGVRSCGGCARGWLIANPNSRGAIQGQTSATAPPRDGQRGWNTNVPPNPAEPSL